MRKITLLLILLVLVTVSCDEPILPKPENLIKEKQMIEILADVHLAEATYNRFRFDSALVNTTSADFYYSVLDKHQVQDSIFEHSFVYYASTPKKFEHMYRKVMNKLSAMEQEFSGRKEELRFEEEDL